jgi:hypothetical protein
VQAVGSVTGIVDQRQHDRERRRTQQEGDASHQDEPSGESAGHWINLADVSAVKTAC